jgi:hypothetical protein
LGIFGKLDMQTKPYFFQIFNLLFLIAMLISCSSSKDNANNLNVDCNTEKIKFKLVIFDKQGLIGEDNGKVALDYEFCIPNTPEVLNTINGIDSSIKPTKSKGRTKCKEGYVLMMGNSYGKDIKRILCNLSQLDYITEINQVYWE